MEVTGKTRNILLPGIALCIISVLLLVIGALGAESQEAEFALPYFFVPLLFLATGVIAVVAARKTEKHLTN